MSKKFNKENRNRSKLIKYVRESEESTYKYQSKAKREFARKFQPFDDNLGYWGNFIPSSYLLIKTFDGDNGQRPLAPDVINWLSPSLIISPLSNPETTTVTLKSGESYIIKCIVDNFGDMIVPAAKVEFFLAENTLGWDSRYATKLGIVSGTINPLGSSTFELIYPVPNNLSILHKCLLCRVFSYSPLDIPIHFYNLYPSLDRHIAQHNLDFIQQNTTLPISWIHNKNANENMVILPLDQQEMKHLSKYIEYDEYVWSKKIKEINQEFDFHFAKPVNLIEKGATNVDITIKEGKFYLKSKSDAILLNPREKKPKASDFVRGSRRMSADKAALKSNIPEEDNVKSRFEINLPNLSLKKNEVFGIKLVNKVRGRKGIKGGITFLITG